MTLGMAHAITDICLLVQDMDRMCDFYAEKVGFTLRRRNEGFADFFAAGTNLALWEADHFAEHVGYPNRSREPLHRVMVAIRVDDRATVDGIADEMAGRGVALLGPPKLYKWNAYCIYFEDPEGNVWEIYAWDDGGPYRKGMPKDRPAG